MKKKIKTSSLILIVFLSLCFVRMIAINFIQAKELAQIENIEQMRGKKEVRIEFNKSYNEEGYDAKEHYEIEVKKYPRKKSKEKTDEEDEKNSEEKD